MQNPDARLVLLDEDHSGRDEMNLAGNPFALLRAASRTDQSFIRREWERTLANGRVVNATWEVNGHAELGLPGPSEEVLYLVLLQIAREQKDESGEWPQTVHFSRHNLFERLRWSGNAKDYRLLEQSFFRLQAVSIQTRYSFHDPKTGAPLPALAFNLIDSFGFVDEKKNRRDTDLPFSWFKWSDVVLNSLRHGNVRSLALDFTLSLDSSISRRLFRLLELLRHARKPALAEVRLDVFDLRDRLGMTSYAHASKIKQVLSAATNELTSRGYLASVEYEKVKRAETAIFRFGSPKVAPLSIQAPEAPKTPPKRREKGSVQSDAPQTESQNEIQIDIRADAAKCHAVFVALDEAQRNELIELAKRDVAPIFWDRVGQVDSPMSLGLWQLVAARYPERLK